MKKVLTYGTFDLFHIGHLNLLNRLRELGDYLIVGVSTDEFNRIKGKRTVIPFEDRKSIVESIKGVDLVIPEYSWDQKVSDIRAHGVDLFAMGSDWTGKFDHLSEHCEVRYLPRSEGVSSTEIKSLAAALAAENLRGVKQALDVAFDLVHKFD